MKKNALLASSLVLSACLLTSSCIGSFGLFNKMAAWNLGLTGNKFVNCLLGFVLTPVYGICLTADWLVLNTIEFWTGKPLVASIGETKNVIGSNGNQYVIVTEKDGYQIKNETTGEEARMIFDEEQQTWSLAQNDQTQKLLKLNTDETVTVYLKDGQEVTVTKDQQGLNQVRDLVQHTTPFIPGL